MPTCYMKDVHTIGFDGYRFLIRPSAGPGMHLLGKARTVSGQVYALFRGIKWVYGRPYNTACAVKVR